MKLQDRYRFKLWNSKRKHFIDSHDIAIGMCRGEPTICMPHHIEGDLEVVMCTGLSDIDGDLIYEGDILLIDDEYAHVHWVDDGFKLIVDDVVGMYELFPQIRSVEGCNDGKAMWGKIVGNTYENVDLLENNKNSSGV